MSRAEAFAPIDRATRRAIGLMIAGALAAFAAAWLVGRAFIQAPVTRLLNTIAVWRRGDLAARTRMDPTSGELEAVGAAFDALVEDVAERQAARERAERHRDMLTAEMSHRVKNTLAIVQSIAAQTFRAGSMPAPLRDTFDRRIQALASAHDVLTTSTWDSADLHALAEAALRPHRPAEGPGRIRIAGPELRLQPRAALALSLALHELATNATKYGALSGPDGTASLSWQVVDRQDELRLRLTWSEHGGPPVAEARAAGFGSRLIEQALAAEIQGTAQLTFEPDGVRCEIESPLAAVAEPPPTAPARPAGQSTSAQGQRLPV